MCAAPYPSSGSGTFLPTQGVPTSHAAGLGVTRLRSFGAGGGGGAWGFVAAGGHTPPVCLVDDLENLHRLLGSTVCGPYTYPEPSPGCWDPHQDPRPWTGAHTQLAGGSAGPDTPRPEGGPSTDVQEAHRSLEGQTGRSSTWEEAPLRPGFCWASSLLNENTFRLTMLVKAWVCVL